MAKLVDSERLTELMDSYARIPLEGQLFRGQVYGDARSRQPGQGDEVRGYRPFESGDDPALIDAMQSAADPYGKLIIRKTYGKRTPSLYVATDMLSARHEMGPEGQRKRLLGLSAAVIAMMTGRREHMPIGLIVGGGSETYGLRPTSNPSRLGESVELFEEVFDENIQAATVVKRERSGWHRKVDTPKLEPDWDVDALSLRRLLNEAGGLAVNRSVLCVVSDFRGAVSPDDSRFGWADALGEHAETNQIIAIEVTAPTDFAPAPDRTNLEVGTAKPITLEHYPDFASEYAARTRKKQQAIDAALEAVGAVHLKLSTADADPIDSLQEQLREAA